MKQLIRLLLTIFSLGYCLCLFSITNKIINNNAGFDIKLYSGLHLNISINNIENVIDGLFVIDPTSNHIMDQMPSFHRVSLTFHPSSDSNIGLEVWIPIVNWIGRLFGTGKGGGAG